MESDEEEAEWVWVCRPNEGEMEWWGQHDDVLVGSEEDVPALKVVFTSPAKYWTDAAPIGNGRLGAMVYGGVANELLQLNDDTLWTGGPGDYTNSQSPAVISKVRKLVDGGNFAEASLEANGLLGKLSEVYQPLGNLNIVFGNPEAAYSGYLRQLDLTTATVKVSYTIDDVEFTREHFCSNPNQVLVTRISSNKPGCVSFTLSLDSQLQHYSRVNATNQIIMEGSCPEKRNAPNVNAQEDLQGIKFSAIVDLQIGGSNSMIQVVDDSMLKIVDADWVVLFLAASSTFDGPFTNPSDSSINPTMISFSTLNMIKGMSFHKLLVHHLEDYQNLFNRVHLHLKGPNAVTKFDMIPTSDRVRTYNDSEDPSLVELLFHYGRYLLISCSRPKTQIANLQGIWNQEVEPAWDAAPHLNINLQMNYWPALSCNLKECQEPLFDYIGSLAVNGAKTAEVNYKTGGWVAHQVSDIWARTSPDRGKPKWAVWPMGGAWLCTHLWEHYLFTMDKFFLENTAYGLLESCAVFLLDWLIDGKGGYLQTNPSTSPEHLFIAPDGQTASISYSSTMDIAIIKEIFSIIISAAEVLGKSDSSIVNQIKNKLLKLPPTRISWDGSIMEWAQDFEDPEVQHRHLSHLFGLFPGHSITLEGNPDLCKAAAVSLYKRGDDGPGWSTTWKMALWAHLHSSEHSYNLIKKLINLVDPDEEKAFKGGLYSNLFTAHPPFQIDANFGFTAAVAEMLVQSTEESLYLLPALPRDKWIEGSVRGLKARGGITVNITWKEGRLRETRLCSETFDAVRKLHYNGNVVRVKLWSNTVHAYDWNLECLGVSPLPDGTNYY